MRTQQQALAELCKGFRPFIRRAFLYEWLEDINWHAEASLLMEGFSSQHAELICHLKKFHIARNENHYSTAHFNHIKKSLKLGDYIKILQDIRIKDESFFMNEIFISPDVIMEYEKAMNAFSTVAAIYGWGINKEEFNGHIQGKALVDELEKMILAEDN